MKVGGVDGDMLIIIDEQRTEELVEFIDQFTTQPLEKVVGGRIKEFNTVELRTDGSWAVGVTRDYGIQEEFYRVSINLHTTECIWQIEFSTII